MRTPNYVIVLSVMLGSVLVLHACGTAVEDLYDPLTIPIGSSSSSGGPDGGDGGNVNCDPAMGAVDGTCGVFVSASAPSGGTGTKTSPYNSLQTAISNASGQYVYACASTPFAEAVTISAPVQLYGGFADCTTEVGWSWTQDARTALNGPADTVALTIGMGAQTTTIEGFAITAADAVMAGGSSIAVTVDNIAATLDHCDVTAGNGATGADGQTPTTPVVNGMGAPAPDPGTMDACINAASVNGGAPGVTMCGTTNTSGGAGGKGGVPVTASDGGTSDSDGQQGDGGLPASTTTGLGGAGESATKCAPGGTGNDGNNGNAGPAGSIAGDTLSLTGITNASPDGQAGTPGQGGGGGGGTKSGTFCPPAASPVDGPGASGGGGGAGGCGGLGGGGGNAGGSSIAIVSLGTKLTLTSVTLAVSVGGDGGKGSLGQGGGLNGSGASGGAPSGLAGSTQGCKGGDGGSGGSGGPGGGGRGGHAIGIAYAMGPAHAPTIMTFTPGTAGSGGMAGPGAARTSNGQQGAAGQCWDFHANAACTP